MEIETVDADQKANTIIKLSCSLLRPNIRKIYYFEREWKIGKNCCLENEKKFSSLFVWLFLTGV